MNLLSLSLASLLNRRWTVALSIFAIALSVALLLGVEKIRTEAKASFASTISGTDLIVGARSGSVQLLLYSVFRIGNATNNISWKSVEEIQARKEVAWTIPLSLGDSHRGFRVLGTTRDYFEHYRYAGKRKLRLAEGQPFDDLFDAVLGADVAAQLGYALDQPIVVDHGLGKGGFTNHKDKPFRVAGILEKTGTPVDRTVHVSLEAIEAIHIDWRRGTRVRGLAKTADEVRRMTLKPKAVTAVLVGLKSRLAVFSTQRWINTYGAEPLLAVLPGVTLQELWRLIGTAEVALLAVSAFVVVTGLLGLMTMLLASLGERRREMAVLRAVGARPVHVLGLLVSEAALVTLAGTVCGLAVLYLGLMIAQPIVDTRFGLFLNITAPTPRDLSLLGMVFLAGIVAGLVPAVRAYRQSVADGIVVRT